MLLIPRETMEWMEEKEARTQREVEALAITERIRRMVGKELVLDRESGEYRPARYGDIVVLLRTMSGWAEDFLQVFAAQGFRPIRLPRPAISPPGNRDSAQLSAHL